MKENARLDSAPLGVVRAWRNGMVVVLPSESGFAISDLESDSAKIRRRACKALVFGAFVRRTDSTIVVLDHAINIEREFSLTEVVMTSNAANPFER